MKSERILDRNLSRAAIADYRTHASPALASLVDEGIAVFERCSASATGGDENLAILFPALHAFEMLDGVSILLHEGAVIPARLPLRSAFEAALYVQYVAEADSTRRGFAFVVEEAHRRLTNWEKYDPTSPQGKELRSILKKDLHGSSIEVPSVPDLATRREGLRRLLAKAHLREAEAEYLRLKTVTRRRPPFYSFWDGPRDLQQLATHLRRGGEYETLYRTWSSTAHGLDLSRQLTSNEELAAVAVFRNSEGLALAYSIALSFGLQTIRTLLSHYRPEELTNRGFTKWYEAKIKPAYLALPLAFGSSVEPE